MILEYLLKYHLQDCIDILSESDNLGYFSIKIDFLKLFETYPDVGDKVLCSPIESLPTCNTDIIKAQQNLLEQDEYKEVLSKLNYYYLKRNVHARFYGLPVCPELHRTVFPKNVDVGCFLKVTDQNQRYMGQSRRSSLDQKESKAISMGAWNKAATGEIKMFRRK